MATWREIDGDGIFQDVTVQENWVGGAGPMAFDSGSAYWPQKYDSSGADIYDAPADDGTVGGLDSGAADEADDTTLQEGFRSSKNYLAETDPTLANHLVRYTNFKGIMTPVSVADIADPSSELSGLSASGQGNMLLVYKANAAANDYTIYLWDSAYSGAEVSPYVVSGSGGKWIAVAGRYGRGAQTIDGAVTLNTLTATRLVKSDASKVLTSQALGTALQVLRTNAGATDVEWAAVTATGVTITVASSTSLHASGADYICDGTADEVQIQAAVTAAAALSTGGEVRLLEGTFVLADKVTIPSNVTLTGAGAGRTVVSGPVTHVFYINPATATTIQNITIRDLTIAASGGFGIVVASATGALNNFTLENCIITSTASSGSGFGSDAGTTTGTGNNWRFLNNYFSISGASTYAIIVDRVVTGLQITGNYIVMNSSAFNAIAVYGDTYHFVVNDNIIATSGGHSSIAISNGYYGVVQGNVVDPPSAASEWGIEMEWKSGHSSANATAAQNVICSGNLVRRASGTGTGGIIVRIDGAGAVTPDFILIANNIVANCTTGIRLEEGTNLGVWGNLFNNVTTKYDLQAGVTVLPLRAETGVLDSTLTASRVVLTDSNKQHTSLGYTIPSTAGTSGKVLVSDGTNIVSSTPTFPNASATSGKAIVSDGTNWVASTPTFPNSSATSGKVIVSDGTNWIASTPTFPNASATSGKIIISDGTNWIASTPTYPNTSATKGLLLYSNGTNFTTTGAGVLREVVSKTGTDNASFNIFTVTTTDESGSNDGGSYSVKFCCHVSSSSAAASANTTSKYYEWVWSRSMTNNAAGTNSTLATLFTGNNADTAAGTVSISTVTAAITETSEFVTTFSITVDLNPNTPNSGIGVWGEVILTYRGFSTPPVIANS